MCSIRFDFETFTTAGPTDTIDTAGCSDNLVFTAVNFLLNTIGMGPAGSAQADPSLASLFVRFGLAQLRAELLISQKIGLKGLWLSSKSTRAPKNGPNPSLKY